MTSWRPFLGTFALAATAAGCGAGRPAVNCSGVNVRDHGGPVLGSVEISALYWNHAQADLQANLSGFLEDIVRSPFFGQLDEYSVGPGRFAGSLDFVPDGVLESKTSLSDADIQAQLRALVSSGRLRPGPQTLAIVFLPAGVVALPPGSGSSWTFEGYHYSAHFPQGPVHYAVIRDASGSPDASRFESAFDFLTDTASHEIAEAVTDPDVDDPAWFDDSLSEIGDICAWKSPDVRVDGYFVQRMWSQRRGACMAGPGPVDESQRVMQSCENAAMKVAECVDVQSNGWNCGGCGNRCAANETCSAGHCQVTPGCHDAICGPAGVALISGAITQTILFPLPLSDSGPSGILLPTGGVRIDLFDWYPLRAQYTELDSTGYIRCYERESSSPTDVRNDIWDVVSGQYGSFTLTITNGYPLRGSLHAECFPATKGAQGIVHLDMTF